MNCDKCNISKNPTLKQCLHCWKRTDEENVARVARTEIVRNYTSISASTVTYVNTGWWYNGTTTGR